MDREQLDALRRQVEEDYKLDIAAIERLQRRFQGVSSSFPSAVPSASVPVNSVPANSVPVSAYSSPNEWSNFESRIEPSNPAPPPAAAADRRSDALEGSLRTMFSSGRK